MESKVCNTCHIEKDISEFSIRSKKTLNRHNRCKQCTNEYAKKYRTKNEKVVKERQKKWYEEHSKYWKKQYEKENRDKINERDREKYRTDKKYRMKKILRSRFATTVNKKKIYKSILTYIDTDLESLLKWIEYQFDPNMSWENQGTYWDLDHVIPCDTFDLTDESEIKKCFHWTNIRPLEKKENDEKNNKIIKSVIKQHKKIVEKYKRLYISGTKLSEKSV